LALYLLDWDKQGRNEQVQITDVGTGCQRAPKTSQRWALENQPL
jgi:hypothetical protein